MKELYEAIDKLKEDRAELFEALRKISITSRYPMSEPENMDFAMGAMRTMACEAIAKAEATK